MLFLIFLMVSIASYDHHDLQLYNKILLNITFQRETQELENLILRLFLGVLGDATEDGTVGLISAVILRLKLEVANYFRL